MQVRLGQRQITVTHPRRLAVAAGLIAFAVFMAAGAWQDRAQPGSSPSYSYGYSFPFAEGELTDFRAGKRFVPPPGIGSERSFMTQLGDNPGQTLFENRVTAIGHGVELIVYLPDQTGSLSPLADDNPMRFSKTLSLQANGDGAVRRQRFTFIPAIPVPADARARTKMEEDFQESTLDTWVKKGYFPVLIGFSDAIPFPSAADRYLRVTGLNYWTNGMLDTSIGAGVPNQLPVLLVGASQPESVSGVRDPALKVLTVRNEGEAGIALRRGLLAIEVERVEFARKETRVWLKVDNDERVNSGRWWQPQAAADKSFLIQLLASGDRAQTPVARPGGEDDAFPTEWRGATSEGYLFFDPIDLRSDTRQLTLQLPDPAGNGYFAVQLPLDKAHLTDVTSGGGGRL